MTGLQWWCAAQNVAWSWTWRPYPGVWLFILALALGYARLVRGKDARVGAATIGILLLWIALDWPVGALGGGYLASLHAVQFLLIAMAAPPLLVLGLPRLNGERRAGERVEGTGGRAIGRTAGAGGRIMHLVRHPLVALGVFTGIIYLTHLPRISDAFMASQWGAFAIDLSWFAGGLLFWWPVVRPGPAGARFTPPLRMGYLFAILVFMTAPGAMITFSDLPLYATYELAPPVGGLSALEDQRLAGLLMKTGGGAIVWIAISILFYRWHREETRLLDRELEAIGARSEPHIAAGPRGE